MSKVKLYIDDLRDPHPQDKFIVLRSYAEAIGWMRREGCPDMISFDHDLGISKNPNDPEFNGLSVVKWMIDRDMDCNGKFIPANFDYTVHSANPVGAANIVGLLQGYLDNRI